MRRVKSLFTIPWITLALLFCIPGMVGGQVIPDAVGAVESDYQWWRDARFGIFIHWSPGCLVQHHGWVREQPPEGHPSYRYKGYNASQEPVPEEIFNGEYKKRIGKGKIPMVVYDNLYRIFDPVKFDADAWAKTFKKSGAGYIIFTIKHTDGFCMYDSKYTDYDIMSSPYGRDIAKALSDACHKQGIKVIWYYITGETYDPRYDVENPKPYEDYLYNQIEELLTNYGDIAGVWWDGGAIKLDATRVCKMMRRLQPGCIYNGRFSGMPPVKFSTPEQRLGNFNRDNPWETCAVIHGMEWWWNGNTNVKSLNTCLRMLIDCAGGDGNLALDFGPSPEGLISADVQERYLGMGKWLKKYGESIYKTRGGPYKPGIWGVSTHRRNTVYLHITQRWPGGRIALPALPAKVLSCSALTGGRPSFFQTADSLVILLDPAKHKIPDTVIKLELDRDAFGIQPVQTFHPVSLTLDAKVRASSSSNAESNKGAPETVVNHSWENGIIAKHFGEDTDDNRLEIQKSRQSAAVMDEKVRKILGKMQRGHFWRYWSPDSGDPRPWIEVDLGAARTFQRVKLTEQYSKIMGYCLQYHNGQEWQTFYIGETIDDLSMHLAEPVHAQRVRLLITETNGELPQIKEFDLFQ